MGIFNFVKDKGADVFNWMTGETANRESEEKIANFVNNFGIPVNDFRVEVDGEKACIHGVCPDQESREKILLAVGNISGISEVDDRIEVQKIEAEARFYTVVGGDTLSKISKEFYGDPMKYNLIFEANKPMLRDPNKIYPGQMLRIPNIEAIA